MHWKPLYNSLLLVLFATAAAYLAAGWNFLPMPPTLFRYTWVFILIILGCTAYPARKLQKDELALFLFCMGGLFLVIGSFTGSISVTLGFLVQLYALYHYECNLLHAPDIPDMKKMR